MVALTSLVGARDETDAVERLQLVPDLAHADGERLRALARWANGLYQGRHQWWNPLEPDLVAEHLVATTYHDHPEVLAGVLVDRPDVVTRPIGLYARAVPDHRQLAAALQPVLSKELHRLCQLALDQAAIETDRAVILGDTTVAAVLARWAAVTAADTGAVSDAVAMLPLRSDLVLSPLAVVLTGQLVERMSGWPRPTRRPTSPTWPGRSTTCRSAWARRAGATRAWPPSRRRWRCAAGWQRPTRRPTSTSWPARSIALKAL